MTKNHWRKYYRLKELLYNKRINVEKSQVKKGNMIRDAGQITLKSSKLLPQVGMEVVVKIYSLDFKRKLRWKKQ